MAKTQFESSQVPARDLAVARRDAARAEQRERLGAYLAGAEDATLELTLEAFRQDLEAELAVVEAPGERLAAHERFVELTRLTEDIVRRKHEMGRVSRADYARGQYARLDAEIRLRAAREKATKK